MQCYLFYIRLKKRHGRELFCCSIITTRFIFICCTCDIINHDTCSRHHEVLLLDACVHYSKQFLVDFGVLCAQSTNQFRLKSEKDQCCRSLLFMFSCLCCSGAPGAEKGGGPGAERGGGRAAGPEQGGPDLVAPARAEERKSEAYIYLKISRQTVTATPEIIECNL